MDRWNNIELSVGDHPSPAEGLCLLEAVALSVGERHSDWPNCVCPILIEFGRVLNDQMPDLWRTTLLLPLVPLLAGTRGQGSTADAFSPTELEKARASAFIERATIIVSAAAGDAEAARQCAAALGEAADNLLAGQAQHAARHAATAAAWSVRAGGSQQATTLAASARELGIWRQAVDAYREVAQLRLSSGDEHRHGLAATLSRQLMSEQRSR